MATFTSTGQSTSLYVRPGHTITVALSGTFAANVALEQAVSGAWVRLGYWSQPVTFTADVQDGTYRLNCDSFTSGTVTYTLSTTAKNQVEFRDPTATVKFSVDTDGGVVGGGSGGGGGSTAPITLTDGATITPDATVLTSGSIGTLTLGGSRTFANVVNLTAGAVWTSRVYIRQDATGSRVMTWGANYKWPGGIAGVLSTAASSLDILDLSWDGTSLIAALSKGFA